MESNHEDTTTTDYDSGDSEGVNFAYEGGRAPVNSKQITKAVSPKRKTKSRSPKRKPRCSGHCQCVCRASQSPPRSDDEVSTEFEEDTDVEGNVENRCQPTQRRLSGPKGAGTHEEKEETRTSSKKASSKRGGRKRTPYIEEYPEEDIRRPVILLKEHKLPRRFSASDAKKVQSSVEDHQDVGSSSRGRSPTGKRLPAWATHQQGRQPHKKHSASSAKQAHHPFELQEAPGGKFSGSDLGSSDYEPEQAQVKALEPSPPRRRSREARPPADLVSSVTRSSAWPEKPQYSSSWPLQSGQHYPLDRHRRAHGYESEDESDETPDSSRGHQKLENEQQRRSSHHSSPQQYRHTRPSSDRDASHATADRGQAKPEPARPRTVVSQRSMATMDQGFRRGGDSPGASLCEVWRGRPEDWESPYASSSDDDEGLTSDLDGERIPARMQLLEGSPPKRDGSVFSRKSRGMDMGAYAASGFLRRSDVAAQMQMDDWERCASPEGLEDGPEVLGMRPRGVSRARSRWTMVAYGAGDFAGGREPSPEPAPQRRWTYDSTFGVERARPRSRSRGSPPVFSARKTREFLSPKPVRAARFDFDAWGRERASRSMLALGLAVA
ncbi:hypothetical protein QBC47DRAFT_458462 [Echria macrotheca]|uniref:Uncharacterized protein n=1 Tax=Echria macrotheca TaxID=438768 RepID=A0AAJ0F8S8_9PEZI|nr:hypothetical protein QBC47DRAFT_458462 [Echria macrotheca]